MDKNATQIVLMLKITSIIKVEPFKVLCEFDNKEIRVVDFLPLFRQWKLKNNVDDVAYPLLDFEKFKKVSIGEGDTLCWKNIMIKHENFGTKSPLAFSPDMLYKASFSLEKFKMVKLA